MADGADTSDQELMQRVSAGDESAFEELIRRFQDQIFGYFRRNGAGVQDAEDLAQEVFVKIYRSSGSYVPTASFATFAFTVARNCWIDFIRRSKRRGTSCEFDETLLVVENEYDSPEERLRRQELEREVGAALARLPEKQRQTLILAEGQGLKYQEIARIMDIPVGTVKSRIFSAIKTLRESLARRGMMPPYE